jgi:hypothetical protein
MHAAIDQILTRWDQEGIRLANDVAGKLADLLGASTATTPANTGWERMRIWAAGQRGTSTGGTTDSTGPSTGTLPGGSRPGSSASTAVSSTAVSSGGAVTLGAAA